MTGLITELRRFDRIELSQVASHPKTCCQTVRYGVFAQLTHVADTGAALAAVPALFRWGPVQWPAFWCDLVDHDELIGDCGVHADVVASLLTLHAVPHARGRAALRPPPLSSPHWKVCWNEARASDAWIGRTVVHHEVIRIGNRWWDPSDARWFSGPGASLEGARVLAVREEGKEWQLDPEASAPVDARPAVGRFRPTSER